MLVAQGYLLCVFRYKDLELNPLDSRLTSEANLSVDIFLQRCSRKLINCWVAYQSSNAIVLQNLSASLLYFRRTQKTNKCMLWSKVRLKMFKDRLWICVLLLTYFIICWITKLFVYQKIHLFSKCLIKESKKNRIFFFLFTSKTQVIPVLLVSEWTWNIGML